MHTRAVNDRQKRLVLVATIMGSAVVTVDSTVVNVALPAIRDDLGGGFAGQQWTANAYLVTLASLILIGGSLAEEVAERAADEYQRGQRDQVGVGRPLLAGEALSLIHI